MSIVAKVLGRVLIKKIVTGADAKLRREKTGLTLTFTSWTTKRPSTTQTDLILWNTNEHLKNGALHVH